MSKHSVTDNLRLISEYVVYDDAVKLFGTTKRKLTAIVQGSAKPDKELEKRIRETAAKIRRREAQLKKNAEAEATRQAKREIHATLRLIGKPDLKIPDYLPPFLRYYDTGRMNSPVFIYDFRKMNATRVMEFFRFMKHAVPNGYYYLTYELVAGGVEHREKGIFFSDPAVGKLKAIHKTQSPVKAIMMEIGTAAADVKFERVRDGFLVRGVSYISTKYMPFCELSGAGSCIMKLDFDFLDTYLFYNDKSARRRVLECGISYPRPLTNLTPEEIAEDEERGADPLTGLVYIWQD